MPLRIQSMVERGVQWQTALGVGNVTNGELSEGEDARLVLDPVQAARCRINRRAARASPRKYLSVREVPW